MTNPINFIDNNDIIDKMPVGLLVLRRDLVVIAWNTRLEQWTGLKKEEILNRELTLFFPEIKHPKYVSRLAGVFDNGPPVVFSAQIHKYFLPCQLPNGKFRTQHTTVTPVKGRNNDILALIAIEDLTELINRIHDIKKLHKAALHEIEERKRVETEREILIIDLKKALSEIKTLSGLLPICSSCKRIRNDQGYWEQIEGYVREHSEAEFSHGFCPECAHNLYPDIFPKS